MTKNNKIKSIAVYMGAYSGNDPHYKEVAIALGKELGSRGYRLVYGGAKTGLMYDIARSAQESGSHLIGVMPQTLIDGEVANFDCDEWFGVHTMHERKAKMDEYADAFIIFPGGFGTLDELAEILTWNQLDIIRKPICLFNLNNFWEPFLNMVSHLQKEGFVKEDIHRLFSVADTIDDCFKKLEEQDLSPIEKWKK